MLSANYLEMGEKLQNPESILFSGSPEDVATANLPKSSPTINQPSSEDVSDLFSSNTSLPLSYVGTNTLAQPYTPSMSGNHSGSPNNSVPLPVDITNMSEYQGMEVYMFEKTYAQAAEISNADAYRTLFLGDLSYFCSEDDLCVLFGAFGKVTTVRIRRGATGESLMHGFIALDSHEAAKAAITELDGAVFMGRNMRVQLSSEGPRPSPPKDGFVQVHVSFISKQLKSLVTEVLLRKIFSPFGAIADVAVKRHTVVHRQNRQSGYGFVYFVDPEAAAKAMSVLKQNTVFDVTLDCSISHKSIARPAGYQAPYPMASHPHQGHAMDQWDSQQGAMFNRYPRNAGGPPRGGRGGYPMEYGSYAQSDYHQPPSVPFAPQQSPWANRDILPPAGPMHQYPGNHMQPSARMHLNRGGGNYAPQPYRGQPSYGLDRDFASPQYELEHGMRGMSISGGGVGIGAMGGAPGPYHSAHIPRPSHVPRAHSSSGFGIGGYDAARPLGLRQNSAPISSGYLGVSSLGPADYESTIQTLEYGADFHPGLLSKGSPGGVLGGMRREEMLVNSRSSSSQLTVVDSFDGFLGSQSNVDQDATVIMSGSVVNNVGGVASLDPGSSKSFDPFFQGSVASVASVSSGAATTSASAAFKLPHESEGNSEIIAPSERDNPW